MHGKRANWDDQAKPSQAPYLSAKPSAAPYLVKKTGEFPKGSRLREVLNAEAHYPDRGTRNGTEFQNWQVNDLMAEFHELEMRWAKTTDVGQKQQLGGEKKNTNNETLNNWKNGNFWKNRKNGKLKKMENRMVP